MTFRENIAAFANHSVVTNAFHLTVMRLVTFAAPLLALWHLLGVLSLADYGVVAFGVSLIQFGALLTDVGLTFAAMQKVSIYRDKRRILGRLIGGVTGVKLMTSAAYSLAVLTYAVFTTKYGAYRPLLFLLPLSIVLIALQPSWLFLGIERARILSRITIIGKAVYLVVLFALVRGPADYMLAIIADAAGNLVIVTLSYLYVGKLGIPLMVPSKRHVSYAFRSGLGFFGAQVASNAYQNTAVIILGFFAPPAAVVVYSVAEQFYKALSQMFAPLALAMYPYLTRRKDMALLLRVMGGVLVSLVLIAAAERYFAPTFFELLNVSKTEETGYVLGVLMIALTFQVTSMMAGHPLFALLGRVDFANRSVLLGAATYFLVVFGLAVADRIDPIAVAWTIVITEFNVLALRLVLWAYLHRQSGGQFAVKKPIRRLLGIVNIPLYLMLSLVPKDPVRWVFGAWNGRRYADNARYVFEEVRKAHPDIHPVWIVKDKALLQEMRANGLPVAYAYGPRGIWAQVRASVAVFSHSVEWDLVATCVAGRCLRVQGWHGIPIKRIGYLDERGVSHRRAATITRFYPHRTDRCDLIFAAGDFDQAVFRDAFNVRPENVVQTGYPRNDRLLRLSRAHQHTPQHFIYAPTLRGQVGRVFDLFERSGVDFKALDTALGAASLQLTIKLHPEQALHPHDKSALDGCTNIKLLPAAFDLNIVLPEVDALITDFSSVYFDFLFLDRPIILNQFEIAAFERETRSLLTPLQDFDLGNSAGSWEGVLDRMQALNASGPFVPDETYRRTKARFFTTVDDQSAARAVAEIRRRQSAAQHRTE